MAAARLGLAIAGAALLAVAGCGDRDKVPQLMNLRSDTNGPDEFSIVPPKPLEMPEDLALLPEPTPGGENRTDQRPKDEAVLALGGTPRVAGAGVPGSDGALVSYAGRQGVAGACGGASTSSVNWRMIDAPAASRAVRVMTNLPISLGVPEIVPVAAS